MFKKEIILIFLFSFFFCDIKFNETKVINKRYIPNKTKYNIVIPKLSINKKLDFISLNSSITGISIYKEFLNTNNIVIVAHSGNGRYGFFKNLFKLEIGDNVFLKINNRVFVYEIFLKFYVNQYDTYILYEDYGFKSITLMTCKSYDSTKRLIVVSKFVN